MKEKIKVMKKIICIVLCAVLLLAMSVPVMAEEHQKSGKAGRGTPVIDGIKDDAYQAAERLYTENVFEESDTPAAQAEVWVLWDDEALYIYADVKDKTPSGSNEGTPWTSDSIEFFFDWDNNHASYDDAYGDNGGQIRYSAYASLFGHDIWTIGSQDYPAWLKANEADNPYVVKTYDGGYIVEAKVCYNGAIKAMAKEGAYLGFGIQVNDCIDADITSDDSARTGYFEWAEGDNANQGWQWAGALDRLILSGDTYVAPQPEPEPEPVVDDAASGGGEAADAEIVPVVIAAAPPPANAAKTGDAAILYAMMFAAAVFVATKRFVRARAK